MAGMRVSWAWPAPGARAARIQSRRSEPIRGPDRAGCGSTGTNRPPRLGRQERRTAGVRPDVERSRGSLRDSAFGPSAHGCERMSVFRVRAVRGCPTGSWPPGARVSRAVRQEITGVETHSINRERLLRSAQESNAMLRRLEDGTHRIWRSVRTRAPAWAAASWRGAAARVTAQKPIHIIQGTPIRSSAPRNTVPRIAP
jgi:hypothetical protein